MEFSYPPSDLDDRFLAPSGWREHFYSNIGNKHIIRYGSVFPSKQITPYPKAVVVMLCGLSEFCEKYFELAHDMLERGHAFWVIDWQYQGKSGRFIENPQKRHSDGYHTDLLDLHKFISGYVKPAAVHPDKGRIPLVMIGHSMGGNIGLRYLSEYPGYFEAAAFSAPMTGISALKHYPDQILIDILRLLLPLAGKCYIPGGQDWHEKMRKSDGTDIFSSDPVRDAIHNAWCTANPDLTIGSPTFRWLYESLKSCRIIRNEQKLKNINIPVMIALAGKERLVDNDATKKLSEYIQNCQITELQDANHEIIMERDDIRNQFLAAFDKMLDDHNITTDEKLEKF